MAPRSFKLWIGLLGPKGLEVAPSKYPHLAPTLEEQFRCRDYHRLEVELTPGTVSPPFQFPTAKFRWGRIESAALFATSTSNNILGKILFHARGNHEKTLFIEKGDTVHIGPIALTIDGDIRSSDATLEKLPEKDKWIVEQAFSETIKPKLRSAKQAMDELRRSVK